MKKMIRRFPIHLFFAIVLIPTMLPLSAQGAKLTAKEVMQKVEDRDTGNTSTGESIMILIDRRGNQRIRHTKMFRKEYDKGTPNEVTKSVSYFLSPADVKDTSFLSFNWEDENREDDSWLYLPALRKVKRIASSDKSGSFMGSDFTYSDIEGVDIKDYDYEFIKESEQVDGQEVWVIGSKPKEDRKKNVIKKTGYTKSELWIRKDIFMLHKGKFWVDKGKKIKFLTLSEVEKIDGIWTAKKLQMVTTKKGQQEHATVLQSKSTVYNQPLEDEMFTTQRIQRGL